MPHTMCVSCGKEEDNLQADKCKKCQSKGWLRI